MNIQDETYKLGYLIRRSGNGQSLEIYKAKDGINSKTLISFKGSEIGKREFKDKQVQLKFILNKIKEYESNK